MNNDTLYAPDIVDFIIRKDCSYESFIFENPGLIASKTIMGTYTVCFATLAAFNQMKEYMGTDYVNTVSNVLGLTDLPSLEESGIIAVQQQPYLNLNGRGVLIGFLDTGIDYTLDIFKYEDGTSKIQYIYDQTTPGSPPIGYPLGTEYTNEQINEALTSDNPYEIVPEQDVSGHGTFLASVASGRNAIDFTGAAPDSEIIMVKLKKAYPYYLERYFVPKEQENAFSTSSVMLGINYILDKSQELHRPVVICVGLGTNYDSHDGFGYLEEYLCNVSNLPGVCTCISVGNESQAKHHFSRIFTQTGSPEDIDIKVGEDAGNIFLIITNNVCDRISVSITSPTGEIINRIPAKGGSSFTADLVLENSIVQVQYFFPLEGSGDQATIIRIENATAGVWTITVYGDIILSGSINAWLPLTGFVSPSVEFLSPDPYKTITSPANSIGPIRCGAYNSNNDSLYSKSSWGPTRLMGDGPDLVAPGYQIGGFYPTGYGYMNGTSVATAITAGAAALLMQWGIVEGNDYGFCTPLIAAFLIRGCTRIESREYPNSQWGYGMLNLLQSFFYMGEL